MSSHVATRAEPELSLGIPVYNGEKFLAELLTCLQGQTFQNFEILISDNASTDRTREICEAYAKRDSRIRYWRNEANSGAAKNFDKTFSLSRAPLFKWAAVDDLLEPTYLERCVQLLQASPDAVAAHALPVYADAGCQPFIFDEDNDLYLDSATGARLAVEPVTGGESRSAIVRFADVLFNSSIGLKIFGVFRREALERTRLFRPNFYAADKAVLLEMALLGRFIHAKETLFIKRFHSESSAALSHEEVKRWNDPESPNYNRRVRTFLGFLTTPVGKPVSAVTKLACFCLVCAHALMFVPIIALRSVGLLRTPDQVKVATLGVRLTGAESESYPRRM